MLTSILFLVLGSILLGFSKIFSIIDYAIPNQIESAISYFLNYFIYFRGIFPIDTLLQVISAYLTFIVLFYGLKIGLYLFAHLPFFGGYKKLPTISSKVGQN